jgi:TetR/AcrR family transcriptional regulator
MDNRSTIVQVAMELFAARGYDGIGVQEIAEKSGVTKPTLYHYFGSKEGLLQALLEEYFVRLCAKLRTAAEYQRDLTQTLTRIVQAYYDFAQANRTFYRLQLGLLAAPPESPAYLLAAKFSDELFGILETVFEKAARDHGNMKGRHQLYAATFLGFIHTYTSQVLAGKMENNADTVYRALHQFMHGIFS